MLRCIDQLSDLNIPRVQVYTVYILLLLLLSLLVSLSYFVALSGGGIYLLLDRIYYQCSCIAIAIRANVI